MASAWLRGVRTLLEGRTGAATSDACCLRFAPAFNGMFRLRQAWLTTARSRRTSEKKTP